MPPYGDASKTVYYDDSTATRIVKPFLTFDRAVSRTCAKRVSRLGATEREIIKQLNRVIISSVE